MIEPDASQTEYKTSGTPIRMPDLWRQTFELCRHPILWLPFIFATLPATFVWQIRRVVERWIFDWFATSRSVFGAIRTQDIDYIHRVYASMTSLPVGLAASFVNVCLFVFALVVTSGLVRFVFAGQEPDVRQILKTTALRWRQILRFSVKCLLTAVILLAIVAVIFLAVVSILLSARWPRNLANSSILLSLLSFVVTLLFVAWVAWWLVPATLRLLENSRTDIISNATRWQGVLLVTVAAASWTIFQSVLPKVAGMLFNQQAELTVVTLVNALLAHVSDVPLYIGLSVLSLIHSESE
jgi:hypothetical protein